MSDDTMAELAEHRFLVVDDEDFMRNLIVRVLGRLGCEQVTTTESGTHALDVFDTADDEPQIVLCDLNMPGMDGIEFLRHLAERDFGGAIVLISGEDRRILQTAESLAQAHALNILGAISKPVTPPQLTEVLSKFAGARAAAAAPAARPDDDAISLDELRAAIAGDQLEPFFQPKISVATRELVGVEALVRWRHPERGLVPPFMFIPLAEENGLIDPLTDVVFDKAMARGGEWRADGLNIKISVNISVDSLTNLELPDQIATRAAAAGVDPANVVLEVTESRLMQDVARTLETLTRLRLKGIGLSIDDFGTGYSSMEQLQRIPFVELKIDRAFVNGTATNADARAILQSSVDLANKLELSTVAEGVEDQDDWDQVATAGCDEVQGYFIARPMPSGELLGWHTDWAANL